MVSGPAAGETQKFATKKDAALYRKIRRGSDGQFQAIRTYAMIA